MYQTGTDQDNTFAAIGSNTGALTPLLQILSENIVPGTPPSYQAAKVIFTDHPLGEILADGGMKLAQSQAREISIPVLGEKRMVAEFERTWNTIDRLGATVILNNLFVLSRVYGIASLGVGERGSSTAEPMDFAKLATQDIFFNVLDPLNTSGSLVLNQDPNSSDFLRPSDKITVNGQAWHHSRIFPKLNGQAIYIDYSDSAFGFVGRSVYQRIMYPLMTHLQTMVTDQMVTQKAGLLVYNAMAPGSIIDNLMLGASGGKRSKIKAGVTGQVLQIGEKELLSTLNMQNLDAAAGFARTNVLKNIASGAGMPVSIVNNETLTEGFGEGSEDAKMVIRHINYIREDIGPAYAFMDKIVQRKAWTPEFYEALKVDYAELPPYDTWLMEATRAFNATWPNLEIEPDSEKSKNEDVKFKSAVALAEVLIPVLDPENQSRVIMWLSEQANEAEHLFASKLNLDDDSLQTGFEEKREQAALMATPDDGNEEKEPGAPGPETERS